MGLGLYDNDKQKYIEEPAKEHGHWYLSEDGALYIVPDDKYGISEIDGPDGEVLDGLNTAYREAETQGIKFDAIDQDAIAQRLGLEVVSSVLKRFDPEMGYYSA